MAVGSLRLDATPDGRINTREVRLGVSVEVDRPEPRGGLPWSGMSC